MNDKSLFDNKKAHWNRFIKDNILFESFAKSRNLFGKKQLYTIKDACLEMLPKKVIKAIS